MTTIGFKYKSANDVSDEKWMKNYEECKAFYEKNGHFPAYKEDAKLNGWARMWWKNTYMKYPQVNEVKAQMLREIGFISNRSEEI